MSDSVTGTYSEQFGEEFQRHILAVAAQHPGFVVKFRTALKPEFFVSNVMRVTAKALFAHVDQFNVLPTRATLIECVKPMASDDDMSDLLKFIDHTYKADTSDAVSVMAKTVEFGKQQALVNAIIDCADDLEKGKKDGLRGRIDEASMVGEDLLDIGLGFAESLEARTLSYLNPEIEQMDTIPTGIRHLDVALRGGLGRGELGILLAPPKRGKTTGLINIAFGGVTAIQGFNVAYYSNEMKLKKMLRRFDDRLASQFVKLKSSDPETYTQKLAERMKKFVRGRLWVKDYPTRTAGPSTIRSHLALLSSQGMTPDLIIVDYADIVKPERRLGEMRHEQAGIYEDLRAIAGEHNAALWTASQGNKASMEKEIVTMADFAESFEKAAIMDAGVAICQTQDEKISGECRLFLMGLRDEEDGRTVLCDIDRTRCLIRSKALFDVAGVRMETTHDDEDELAGMKNLQTKTQTTTTTYAPKSAKKVKKKKSGPPSNSDKKVILGDTNAN